jgi:hypothetical protein
MAFIIGERDNNLFGQYLPIGVTATLSFLKIGGIIGMALLGLWNYLQTDAFWNYGYFVLIYSMMFGYAVFYVWMINTLCRDVAKLLLRKRAEMARVAREEAAKAAADAQR